MNSVTKNPVTKNPVTIESNTTNEKQCSNNVLLQENPHFVTYNVECTKGIDGVITVQYGNIITKYKDQNTICANVDFNQAYDGIEHFYCDDSSGFCVKTLLQELRDMNLQFDDKDKSVVKGDKINVFITDSSNKTVLIKCTKNNSNPKESKYTVVELTEHLTTTKEERKDIEPSLQTSETISHRQDDSSVLNNRQTQKRSSKFRAFTQDFFQFWVWLMLILAGLAKK